MSQIIYRGKRLDNREWVKGFYLHRGDKAYICPNVYALYCYDGDLCLGAFIEVDPSTIGQYTGLTDKTGKQVFAGDIVRTKYGRLCRVVWFHSETYVGWDFSPINAEWDAPDNWDLFNSVNLEVVGNIYDNSK